MFPGIRTDCCFSPDDKLLLTGTSVRKDEGNGKLMFFERQSLQKVYEIEVANTVGYYYELCSAESLLVMFPDHKIWFDKVQCIMGVDLHSTDGETEMRWRDACFKCTLSFFCCCRFIYYILFELLILFSIFYFIKLFHIDFTCITIIISINNLYVNYLR